MKNESSGGRGAVDNFAVLARWLLGAAWVGMGISKALHPVDFLKLVRAYEIVQNYFWLNSIAAVLPWFEIFCGLLLLAGIAVRGTALLLVLMLVSFTGVVFHRALDIMSAQAIPFWAVKFDCGCGTGEVFIWQKLLENSGLILLSLWLLSGPGRKLCARYSL
jgi:uncharacterized membrane protein YphA (DoxX/SURF4 family)